MKNKKFKQYKSDLTISNVRENSTSILNISSVKCFAMTDNPLFIRLLVKNGDNLLFIFPHLVPNKK